MIWIKQKEIVVDCFTYHPGAYKLAPISNSRNIFPEWWKKLTPSGFPHLNMKQCVGFKELFLKSFYMPFWSELKMEISQDSFKYEYADGNSTISFHNERQFSGFIDDKKHFHFKIISPWAFSCNTKLDFLMLGATWNGIGFNDLNGLTVLPGLLNFYYQGTPHANCILNKPSEGTNKYMFNVGQPLGYYVPLTDKKVKIKTHFLSYDEFVKQTTAEISSFFNSSYYKIKKIKDKLEKK